MLSSYNKNQQGVGLIEVLVALVLLAVAVLGYVGLQYRSLDATVEGSSRVEAMALARDLAERIRVNRNALNDYTTQLKTAAEQAKYKTDCEKNNCTETDMADFDVAQVVTKANTLGMSMNIMPCPKNQNSLNCIYVSWGETSPTNGDGAGDCTKDNAYHRLSTCIIMETY